MVETHPGEVKDGLEALHSVSWFNYLRLRNLNVLTKRLHFLNTADTFSDMNVAFN